MDESYLGEIRYFAGTFTPEGWAACDGQLLSIAENQALFSLLGTQFGGDGSTTFAVPDLRGRVMLGVNGTYQLGEAAGSEQVQLTADTLPTHTHVAVLQNSSASFGASNAQGTLAAPVTGSVLARAVDSRGGVVSNYVAARGLNQPVKLGGIALSGNANLTPSGGSEPHENRMPFVSINAIICTSGVYPSFA